MLIVLRRLTSLVGIAVLGCCQPVATLPAGTNADEEQWRGGYPLQSSNLEKFESQPRNADGTLQTEHNGETYFNPVRIFSEGLAAYNAKLAGVSNAEAAFELVAGWALKNIQCQYDVDQRQICAWFYETPLQGSGYNLPDRWASAMSQGYGLAMLAFILDQSPEKTPQILELAEGVLGSFRSGDVAAGGVMDITLPYYWADEYPSLPRRHVLNGYIFAMAGVWTYLKVTDDPTASHLFDDMMLGLISALPNFVSPINSFYDFGFGEKRSIATVPGYHDLHIDQLQWLCTATGSSTVCEYAQYFFENSVGVTNSGIIDNVKPDTVIAPIAVDPIKHGQDRLFDGSWTYGYYSTLSQPAEFQLAFSDRHAVDRLVLVEVGHQTKCPEVSLKSDLTEHLQLSCVERYTHATGVHKSTVWLYSIQGSRHLNTFALSLVRPQARLIAIREIAILGPKDQPILFNKEADKP